MSFLTLPLPQLVGLVLFGFIVAFVIVGVWLQWGRK